MNKMNSGYDKIFVITTFLNSLEDVLPFSSSSQTGAFYFYKSFSYFSLFILKINGFASFSSYFIHN